MNSKIATIVYSMILCSSISYGQTTSDTLLRKISEDLKEIKDEVVKEKPQKFLGQSVFEDTKGKSAIFLPEGGTFAFNMADASLKLSYANRVSDRDLFFGFDIGGKSNNGILPLISKGNISPGAKVNGVVGFKEFFNDTKRYDGWLALKVGYEGASFKLYNPDTTFDKQISKTSFNAFVSSLNFNLKIDGNKLFAVSFGFQNANNFDDLDDVELNDKIVYFDSISNTSRSYETKTNAKIGSYKTFNQVPINVDYFWTPRNQSRIGFYHYWRTNITLGDNVKNGLGTGIYLLKKKNPLASLIGVVFEVKDLEKFSENYGKGFTINIVASYNFGGK